MAFKPLPQTEWLTPYEALAWVAFREHRTLEELDRGSNEFLVQWRLGTADRGHPLLPVFEAEARGEPYRGQNAERLCAKAQEMKAARGLDAASLVKELKAACEDGLAECERFEWAEQELMAALARGRVRAGGKPLPVGSRRHDVPVGDAREPMPREAFGEHVYFDIIDSRLVPRLDRLESSGQWRGPDWWDVRVARADLLRWWPAPQTRKARDPFAASTWTLLETLAWVAFRDAKSVRVAEQEREGHWEEAILPNGERRMFQARSSRPSMETLAAQFIGRNDDEPMMARNQREAGDMLREQLTSGAITAFGLADRRGDPRAVPKESWDYLEFDDDQREPCARPSRAWAGGTIWTDLRFPVAQTLKAFPPPELEPSAPARKLSYAAASIKYRERLVESRKQFGQIPKIADDELWAAQNGIAREVLRRLRREAARDAPRKGGRPRKSSSRAA